MLRRFGVTILKCLATVLLVGCQSDPYYSQYARTKPSPADMAGVWHPDAASRDELKRRGYKVSTHTLELKDDGSVIATNIPDCWDFDNRNVNGGFDSAEGTWRIEKNQDYWVLNLHFPRFNGKEPGQVRSLMLTGQKPPFKIHATIGDPDEGRAMTFEKESGGGRP